MLTNLQGIVASMQGFWVNAMESFMPTFWYKYDESVPWRYDAAPCFDLVWWEQSPPALTNRWVSWGGWHSTRWRSCNRTCLVNKFGRTTLVKGRPASSSVQLPFAKCTSTIKILFTTEANKSVEGRPWINHSKLCCCQHLQLSTPSPFIYIQVEMCSRWEPLNVPFKTITVILLHALPSP